MVHLIPVVLILCALVLWFFSHPEIDAVNKDDVLARVKNMTIEGYRTSNWNSSAMATGGVEDVDPIDGIGMEDPGKELNSKDPE
ncbi:uncharacterized protein A4U43_C08F7010 [Asparagus officinalis]|nr:uncharacterized protein A4U43_C08F7010 [Asparagus officinalis]